MEAEFEALNAAWQTIHSQLGETVKCWDQNIKVLIGEQNKLRNEGRWISGRDDFLGVLVRHRDELTHSQMIAWLLNPSARHGLGTRFLAAVATSVFADSCDLSGIERAVVRREVQVGEGRVDIEVRAPQFHLVIENKVDSIENGQCARYLEHMPDDARCILLSPNGRKAKTFDDWEEGDKEFKPLRYSQLAEILGQALADVSNCASGRSIVEAYLKTLRKEFS